MTRGDRHEPIFKDNRDRNAFIKTLGQACAKTEWHVHGGRLRRGGKKLGWKEADLAATRKGDPRKVKLALRLRAETAATIKWIAQRLQMGSWTHVNHLLYWHRKKSK